MKQKMMAREGVGVPSTTIGTLLQYKLATELVGCIYSRRIQLIVRPYVPLGTRDIGNR